MSRNRTFIRYIHDSDEPYETPMHSHTNGQLSYVYRGSAQLRSPEQVWVVPRDRIMWIPPGKLHSARSEKLSSGWKIMIPSKYAPQLPPSISVLHPTELIVAALRALPKEGQKISEARKHALIELIKLELKAAKPDAFGITLPRSKQYAEMVRIVLKNPADRRGIDQWAKTLGMSRRSFTRHFSEEVGSSFELWKRNIGLSLAISFLAKGSSVSDTADRMGYASPSAFVAAFRKKFGMSPKKYTRA